VAGAEGVERPLGSAAHRHRLARSTALFAGATGGSRILGLVREIVVRRYFGVVGDINVFTVAFQVPNLIRSLVADQALTSAFVPVFSELLARGDRARAWRVASTVFYLLFLGLSLLTALFVLLAPWLMRPFGYTGAQEDLLVGLSCVLFPTVVLLGLSGVIVGVLNSYEEFTIPALSPILWNLVIILALVIGVPFADSGSTQLYILALAVVGGTLAQVLFMLPWFARLPGRLAFRLDWRDPLVKRVFALMLPVALGLGLINVNLVIDTFFAARLLDKDLAPAAIDAAFRIYMLPQGMFSVAVATVLFPALSRIAASGDAAGFRRTVSLGVRQIGFTLLPASAVLAVLAEPVVRLLFQRGAFTADQTTVVAQCLVAFTVGLTFNGIMLMLNRGFFSLQSPWIPTWVAVGALALNAALDVALAQLGTWGIPLATSLVNVAGVGALVVLLRREVGPLDGRRIVGAYLQILLAAAACAGVAYGVWRGLDRLLGASLGGQIGSVGLALAAATATYLVLARLLGIRELGALLSLVGRTGRRSGGRPA
jgi:putative peptidoglycan lipid II flippase